MDGNFFGDYLYLFRDSQGTLQRPFAVSLE